MKKTILNLGTVLNRSQLKQIKGGGTCAYYNSATGHVAYNVSRSRAKTSLAGPDDHWCCSSCEGASWYDGAAADEEPV